MLYTLCRTFDSHLWHCRTQSVGRERLEKYKYSHINRLRKGTAGDHVGGQTRMKRNRWGKKEMSDCVSKFAVYFWVWAQTYPNSAWFTLYTENICKYTAHTGYTGLRKERLLTSPTRKNYSTGLKLKPANMTYSYVYTI